MKPLRKERNELKLKKLEAEMETIGVELDNVESLNELLEKGVELGDPIKEQKQATNWWYPFGNNQKKLLEDPGNKVAIESGSNRGAISNQWPSKYMEVFEAHEDRIHRHN